MRFLNWSIVENKDNQSDVEKKYPLKGELNGLVKMYEQNFQRIYNAIGNGA